MKLFSDIYLGARKTAEGITYFLKVKNIDILEEQPSNRVIEVWPDLLIDFLQSRLRWIPSEQPHDRITITPNPLGDPIRITCEYFCYIIN